MEASASAVTPPLAAAGAERVGGTRRWLGPSLAGLGFYLLVSFLFFGARLVVDSGAQYVGPFDDPQVAIWDFAWVPHAVLHGENPFVTHAVWAPSGVNLTWATSVPGLAAMFAVVTLPFGAVAGYNTAMVVLPALAAWTAFLLCRRLTGTFWPALAGGALFGFSSIMLAQEQGHIHFVGMFLVPLSALVGWRYLEGELGGKGLVVRLGPILALQLLISTELVFTLSLALFGGMIVAWLVAPARRSRLVSMLGPVSLSYCAAGVMTAPFLYFLAAGLHTHSFTPPQAFGSDLANIVIPTHLQLLGIGWTNSLTRHFPGNLTEQGLFIGPALLIVVLFAWRLPWGPGRRFLYISLAIATLATLGTRLHVYGHSIVWLPWSVVVNQPIWDNVLPVRLSLYVWLAVAVIVALWTAGRRQGFLRFALPILAVLALIPNVGAKEVATTYRLPPFFTDSAYRTCLHPGEIVLPVPIGINGYSDLWQVADGFRFRMAGGRVQITPPSPFMHPGDTEKISQNEPISPRETALFREFIRAKGVEAVVVDPVRGRALVPALNRIVTPQKVGGILLYRVSNTSPVCRPGA